MRADEDHRGHPDSAAEPVSAVGESEVRRVGEAGAPVFRDLGPDECVTILERNVIGRIAYSFRDRVSIEPVSYVYHDGWIYGRTSESAKLDVLRHSRWVAFEVDEVDGLFEWRSVVVHGGFYTLEADGARLDRQAYRRGLELMRRLIPTTGTLDDPVPHRNVLFRIHADELTGREATTRAD